ncbi:MAG: glycosyltransferase [Lachnospiraceae bacterium]|nr:glycosyltransferase [Lachnospiraceae bacterium]
MAKYAVVMPAANEESTIEQSIKEIMAFKDWDLHLYIIIDRYSKDRTEEIIRNLQNQYEKLHLVFYQDAKGVATCYLYGFQVAIQEGADFIIEMDAGGSHNPKDIPRFIEKLSEGYECVWGSRYMKEGAVENLPLYRRFISRGGTILANVVLGTKLMDMTSGYEAFRSEVLQEMDLSKFLSRGHMYQTEMRFYCRNRKAVELPIIYTGSTTVLKLKSVTDALSILFQLKKHESVVCSKSF